MFNGLIVIFCKFVYFILKLFGKNGGNFPGIIAYKLNKRLFKYFKFKGKVIVVTGTNGKTTTTNFINYCFKNDNKNTLCNDKGNNIASGILTSLIINSKFDGTITKEYVILEIDEHWLSVIAKDLKIDTIVILNFFRDQLDRSGEVETLILKLSSILKDYTGNLVVNGDDPNAVRLSLVNKNIKTFYYKVDSYNNATTLLNEVGEGKFCPFCNSKLKYNFYQYSHIGDFYCDKCNFGKIKPYLKASNINTIDSTFDIDKNKYKIQNGNIYNIYNAISVILVCKLYNIKVDSFKKSLSSFELNNGRLENFNINNKSCLLTLAKNPTGFNVSLKVLYESKTNSDLMIVLNDNIPDGVDVSWIWDINLSYLENVDRVICSGLRAYDIAIRIKCSGFDSSKIFVYDDIDDGIEKLFETDNYKFIITNYTANNITRKKLVSFKEKIGD